MRRISILAILTLVLMAVELCSSLVGYWGATNSTYMVEQAMSGMEKPEGKPYLFRHSVELNVFPLNENIPLKKVYNNESHSEIPCTSSKIVVGGWLPIWVIIIFGLFGLACFPLVIWGVINYVKFMLAVFKQQIFTPLNSKRLRIFVYTIYGTVAMMQLVDWISYQYISSQVELSNYAIGAYEGVVGWADILFMVLIVEIFAKGVKLQQEQALTI